MNSRLKLKRWHITPWRTKWSEIFWTYKDLKSKLCQIYGQFLQFLIHHNSHARKKIDDFRSGFSFKARNLQTQIVVEKVEPVVMDRYKFELRDMSKVTILFGIYSVHQDSDWDKSIQWFVNCVFCWNEKLSVETSMIENSGLFWRNLSLNSKICEDQ